MTSPEPLDARAEAVRAAVTSAQLAGAWIAPDAREAFDAYVAGTIDADELVLVVLKLYGPDA